MDMKLPNNFVNLHGYVKKLFLRDKVGTISLCIESKDKSGKEYKSTLNVTLFKEALAEGKKLQEYQFCSVQGRLSNRENNGQWKMEVVGIRVTPHDKFQVQGKAVEESFQEAFGF